MGTMTQPAPMTMPDNENDTMSDTSTAARKETRRTVPVTYPHDEHLLQEAKG